jgi:Tol biopolymer transport system component
MDKRKRICCLSTLLLAGLLTAQLATAQKNDRAEVLLQAAQHKQLVEGDLKGAIKIYDQIVANHGNNRAVTAKALIQKGRCYEKMGSAEARKAYDRVVRDYADQREMVAEARARLSTLSSGRSATASTGKATGATVRQVWAGGDVDSYGSPSPDGRFLSYTDWSTGDLAMRDLANGKDRRLTNKGTWAQSDQYAEFSKMSPDGRQIAYAWFNDKFYDLRVVGVDGANPRVVYSNPDLKYVQPSAWFPDGKHLVAVFSRADRTNQIVLVSLTDGSVRTLKTMDWRYPQRLSLSADARWIAYDFPPIEVSSKNDIYLLATDGSREVRLIEHPAHDYVIGWSPAGERLLFATDRTGTVSVWALRVTSGNPQGSPEMIKHDAGQINPLGLTPDGALYYSMGGTRDVYIGEVDTVTGKIQSRKNASDLYVGANSMPDWSMDGEYLAYLSRRTQSQRGIGSRVIVIRSVKTGEEREISPKINLPTNHRGGPRLSPDGRFLVVVGRDEKGRLGIYRINAQTAEVSPVIQSQPGLSFPEWTIDGKVIFSRKGFGDDDNDYLVVRDPESGEERILHKSRHIHAITISPDRRRLAFSTELIPGDSTVAMSNVLMIIPVSGGQPTEVFRLGEKEEFTALAWPPGAGHLLFISGDGGVNHQRKQVFRIPVAGGKPEPTQLELGQWNWERQLMGLRFHPDGKRVAFTDYSNSTAEILVMENFLPKNKSAR